MEPAPRLETRSGTLLGRREGGLAVFRGVPFARPPVGSLRWAPPEREGPWTGVREASGFGPVAPQRPSVILRLLGMGGEDGAEDCLTLNVWTPALGERGAGRPVLVWLHGGAFTAGAGSIPFFDGARLATRGDAVVVTINYRLGALGFLVLEDRLRAGEVGANFGLLDQAAALAWVQEHAERLGGDPRRVTVFGESAGAMSIGALLGAPAAHPHVRRAILQSGAAHNVSPLADGLRIAELFRAALGMPGADTEALRALPPERVMQAQQRVVDESWREITGLAFQPVVDGTVLPRPPLEAVAAGSAREIELLVGSNLDEWNLFALTDSKLATLDEDGLVRRLLRAPPDPRAADPEAVARRAAEVYRRAREGRGPTDPRSLWLAMQSDRVFRVPAQRLLEAQRPHQPNVYAYLFTWPSPAAGGLLGSCHGLEIPFVFGTVETANGAQLAGEGPEALRLAARVQEAWLSFARDGDPGWPAWDEAKRATMRLGRECSVEPDPFGDERRFWDGLL